MKLNKFTKVFLITVIFSTSYSNKIFSQIDSVAVVILDKMNNVIGNLSSCSLTLTTEYDIYNTDLGLVKHSETANIFLKAPDKLFINKKGDKGNREFFYDGKIFTYYSPDNKQYAMAEAPPTIMEMIDNFHTNYGIDFPAADLFYPDFVDDVLASANGLSYLGLTNIGDKKCFHIAGTTNDFTFQIWIGNNEKFLPEKLVIVYTNQIGNPQYAAQYKNWDLNPTLQDSMFDFTIPAQAKKIKFLKKNN